MEWAGVLGEKQQESGARVGGGEWSEWGVRGKNKRQQKNGGGGNVGRRDGRRGGTALGVLTALSHCAGIREAGTECSRSKEWLRE